MNNVKQAYNTKAQPNSVDLTAITEDDCTWLQMATNWTIWLTVVISECVGFNVPLDTLYTVSQNEQTWKMTEILSHTADSETVSQKKFPPLNSL